MNEFLHLHVGLPKCGSSSLQAFLRNNRKLLGDEGFAYPGPTGGPLPNLRTYLLGVTGRPGDAVFQHNNPDARLDTAAEDLWTAVDQSEASSVILSAEELFKYRDDEILDGITGRFKKTFIHMVLRPKVDWVTSGYSQGVKTGRYKSTMEEFLKSRGFRKDILPKVSYAQHLAFWQHRFGAENVAIHFVGRGFPSVVDQFLAAAGLDFREPERTARRNQSPSAFMLSACIAANTGSQEDFLKINKTVLKLAGKHDPRPEAGFLSEEVEAIMAPIFAPDTEALLKLQDRITAEDLHPDNSEKHVNAVSFEEIVSSEAFAALEKALKRKGIALTNLRGALA